MKTIYTNKEENLKVSRLLTAMPNDYGYNNNTVLIIVQWGDIVWTCEANDIYKMEQNILFSQWPYSLFKAIMNAVASIK